MCEGSGSTLRRLVLVVGFVGIAWFLGSAAASADERGGADTPAPVRGVAESASEAGENVQERAGAAIGSDVGQAAEQPAEPARSVNAAVTSANTNTPSLAEAAQSSPDPDVPAVAEHNVGIDPADEVSDTVEQGTRATERIAESGDTDDAPSAGGSRAERTGSAGGSAPDSGERPSDERPQKDQWDARNSAAHSGSPAAATAVGASANPTEDGPDRGGAPATSPISSAPQAHSGTTVPVPAGFLPADSIAPPKTGMHETPRHALTMVPQDPADEPTVSPD